MTKLWWQGTCDMMIFDMHALGMNHVRNFLKKPGKELTSVTETERVETDTSIPSRQLAQIDGA
ncbi:hypothetical protein PAAG_03730 [Paracoccidioides lutzii Pb01]|uniref:Uncharacterized protein n=1 Tax=Paracoccidioides lutzii (strain ATCC MYA-826 / Pb01) TaxID=502779 RepID=C1GYY6_PARBA|nr:hypothetical protein PAAG_03730 [Paracoccidioides lutzii Pb01]EEH41809.2 hypothetical protein PAAG_03730 [Paracoccidioides lutzii Pb01]